VTATCDVVAQGWEAAEAKTEAMDAFVNVATDMAELTRLVQQWQVNDEAVRRSETICRDFAL
jgi:hypothetical protein